MITELPIKILGMSNEAYRQEKDFDSRSFIHTVARFGGEVQQWIDEGNVYWGGNAATAKGSDFDSIITGCLEGKSFDSQVVVPPEDVLGSGGSRSTKAYREWAAQQTGIICTADQRWAYKRMYDSLWLHPAARDLWKRTNETQASVFFEHEGHLLKVRPDAGTPDGWWDLKTTGHPWNRIHKSAIDYGYAEQEWLYVLGAKAIGMPHFRMPFVFVQTSPPFATRVFYLPEQMVENAGKRMLNTLSEIRLRRSTGEYLPADADEIQEMYLPNWAMKEEEEVVI